MRTPAIDSLLLASTDPNRLRHWYATALDAHADPDGFMHFGHVAVLLDERGDLAPRTLEPGRVILNYHVTDIEAHRGHLDTLGVEWISPAEYRADAGAWFATLVDPDGNLVQLIELTPEYWVKRRERHGVRIGGPLTDASAAVRLPAQDLDRARAWYAEKLGLEPVETRDGGLRYECGGTSFVLFASTGKASGTHTQMGFTVADIEATAAELRGRGVELLEEGIADVTGNYPSTGAVGERAIWFHYCEGNLLGVGQFVYA
jgi:catechol 2,3-dioxygenase-like lactoylglutathione lyase family enzyme